MAEILFSTLLEIKTADESGEFEGYASTFGNVDAGNDVVMKGAFDGALDSGTMPGLFWQHDQKEPIGEWTQIKEDAKGLWVKGKLWIGKGIARADQAYQMLKAKGPVGLSIGFIAKSVKRDVKSGARQILKVALKEVSVVTFPMNELARVVSVKSAADISADRIKTAIIRNLFLLTNPSA